MSARPIGLLGDIKKLMFYIIQCKLKICILILEFTFYIINQICHTILHPALAVCYLFEIMHFICNVRVCWNTLVHCCNAMTIR